MSAAGKLVLRLDVSHAEDCWAKENYSHPFIVFDGTERDRRANGMRHKNASHSFHRLRCNDADCPAILLVSELGLAEFIGELLSVEAEGD